jgi:hypothetical protein
MISKQLFPEIKVERVDERFTSKMAFQTMIDMKKKNLVICTSLVFYAKTSKHKILILPMFFEICEKLIHRHPHIIWRYCCRK